MVIIEKFQTNTLELRNYAELMFLTMNQKIVMPPKIKFSKEIIQNI